MQLHYERSKIQISIFFLLLKIYITTSRSYVKSFKMAWYSYFRHLMIESRYERYSH